MSLILRGWEILILKKFSEYTILNDTGLTLVDFVGFNDYNQRGKSEGTEREARCSLYWRICSFDYLLFWEAEQGQR